MKINYCMTGFWASGGSRTILKITDMLIDRGHDVSITAFLVHPKAVKTRAKVIAAPFYTTSMRYVLNEFLGGLSKKLFSSRGYSNVYAGWEFIFNNMPDCDVNVATDSLSVYPMLLSGRGVPFYHMQHYEELFFDDDYLKSLTGLTYGLPVKMIANSIWLRDKIAKEHGMEPVIINPGYDQNIFRPRGKKAGSDKKIVVCYSNVREWKGFRDALSAMEMVFSKRRDVDWVVYGYNPSKLRSDKAPYRKVDFPSNTALAELYSGADVVFSPSWYESFPGPPIEAMLCGAPVVTTAIGVEDYAVDGETAIVVPPRDPAALASGILRLLDDKSHAGRLRERALERAKGFTWEKTVDKVEQLFKKTLSGGK